MIHNVVFDLDDTLIRTHEEYNRLVTDIQSYLSTGHFRDDFYKMTDIRLKMFGYGPATFIATIMHTISVSDGIYKMDCTINDMCINWLSSHLQKPCKLFPDAHKALGLISRNNKYILRLMTKGDEVSQRLRLKNSGLEQYFDSVDVVTEKSPYRFTEYLDKYDIQAQDTTIIGDSLRSDVFPAVSHGANATLVSHKGVEVWSHEDAEIEPKYRNLVQVVEGENCLMRAVNSLPGMNSQELSS